MPTGEACFFVSITYHEALPAPSGLTNGGGGAECGPGCVAGLASNRTPMEKIVMLTRRFKPRLRRVARIVGLMMLGGLVTFLVLRGVQSMRGEPLQPWHKHAPEEMSRRSVDKSGWEDYLSHEERVMQEVWEKVTQELPECARVAVNRYYENSPLHAANFAMDWNRSFVMMPEGQLVGAVVLLHGLTDSPYSLRTVAEIYRDHGFVAVAPRMPGHGTTPAGLVRVRWETWAAVVRLAVREAVRLAGEDVPLHFVGYSNGGALALDYALDARSDGELPMPTRLVLFSPMIGVTELARFAGVAGWPAVFPAFSKAAWSSVVPEFNPFKYNSFPINGARQSSQLTRSLQRRLARGEGAGGLPPVLTFQSKVDATTSTVAVAQALYNRLPDNGSELVLFDLNRSLVLGPLMRRDAGLAVMQALPPEPRRFAVSLVTNAPGESGDVYVVHTPAHGGPDVRRALGAVFPPGVVSLSHVALPFPPDDPLYGFEPPEPPEFGVNLGAISPRGERGALVVSLGSLVRMSSNPFFSLVEEKLSEAIRADLGGTDSGS